MTFRWNTILLAGGLALGSTLVGFGLIFVFPQIEQAVLSWQATYLSPDPVRSRVVLVDPPKGKERACSPGRWHPEEFETVILAMKQAGASVVASLEDFSYAPGASCRDLGSLARLAETTKRVGNVVYPDSAPVMLRQAAAGLGSVQLSSDDENIVGGLTLASQIEPGHSLPIGLSAASFVMHEEQPLRSSLGAGDSVVISSGNAINFPVHSFETLRDLYQTGDLDGLAAIGKEKVLLISSQAFPPSQQSSLGDRASSIPVLHGVLAHSALTHSWLAVVPPFLAIPLTVIGGVCIAFLLLCSYSTYLSRWVVPIIVMVGLAALCMLPQAGWVWPLGGTILSISFTATASLVWRTIHLKVRLQSRVRKSRVRLARLQEELVGKEEHVRDLELRLEKARSEAHESDSCITGLHESQESLHRQLRVSEEAVASTRDRIRHLEDELISLRQAVPVSLPPKGLPSPAAQQILIQECERFNILTRDPKLLELFERLKKAAITHSPILLLGETGTGKEVFARAAHALSSRRSGPFVSVNMAAIRPELFEGELFGHVKGAFTGAVGRVGLLQAANGGTLFLDEVGELPPEVQGKLLRVLEDGAFYRVGDSRVTTVDVRIVAATNRDLIREVEEGRYREDLYYRLRSMVLTLPPLRERIPDDRRLLAQTFLSAVGKQHGRESLQFSTGAMEAILSYRWPGNVRELKQTIAQAVALTEESVISEANLQLPKLQGTVICGRAHSQEDLDRLEDLMVLKCLRRHRFDMQATARELGWDRSTVTQRLKGLGFQALVDHQGNVPEAARVLAGDEALARVVEGRLREYWKNLLPASKQYRTAEEAIADCRKRLRNLPDRHFPAVERLILERFSGAASSTTP